VPLIDGWLSLRLVSNPGAAFSFGSGATWVFPIVAAAVCVVIVIGARRLNSQSWAWAVGLLLGGALGNLLDRLIRPPGPLRGHVVDFIDYRVFVGNVADIFIVAAAGLMILLAVRGVAWSAGGDQPDNVSEDPTGQADGAGLDPAGQRSASEVPPTSPEPAP
jgi:signal peptidase II